MSLNFTHFNSYLSLCLFLCLCARWSVHGLEGLQSFLFWHCRPVQETQGQQTYHVTLAAIFPTLINYKKQLLGDSDKCTSRK